MTTFMHDPQAVLPYAWDWTAWLAAEGSDTIAAATVAVVGDGLTLADDPPVAVTTTRVTAWLSGGTAGDDVDVRCHITTDGGREDERTITIKVRDR